MKRLAVTMGEPGGVGPEVALKALVRLSRGKRAFAATLVGDASVFEEAASMLGLRARFRRVEEPHPMAPGVFHVVDVGSFPGYSKGRPTADGGRASALSVERAVGLVMGGKADAIVTGPISKEAFGLAGVGWPGHTEMLAGLTGTRDYAMMLAGGAGRGKRLRVLLVTIHRALAEVPDLVTEHSVSRSIMLAQKACMMLGIRSPSIAVAGLNPHAGEGGMFGREDVDVIAPAVAAAARRGVNASGPYPPDTVFMRAARGEFDIVVSMYHDQGLIPIKMVAFDRGINVTVGLPFVRTSPDHGTAYDIAWKGVADEGSMFEAARAALSMKTVP